MTTPAPSDTKKIDYVALSIGFAIAIVLGGLLELGALLIALIAIGSYLLIKRLRAKRGAAKGHVAEN